MEIIFNKMVVRVKERPEGEEKKHTLNPVYVEGINETDFNIPGLNHLLRKIPVRVPVVKDFTADSFADFYHTIETRLEDYGQVSAREKFYRTVLGEVHSLSSCRDSEQRRERIYCGSYIRFEDQDRTLSGTLYVGNGHDREWQEAHGAGHLKSKAAWVLDQLRKEGIPGAADLSVAWLLRRLYLPAALLSAGDLGRRVYNMVKFDAHWSLDLQPAAGVKVTEKQLNSIRRLVDALK